MARIAVNIPTKLHVFQNTLTQRAVDAMNAKYAGIIIPLKANGVEIGQVKDLKVEYSGEVTGTIFEIEESYNPTTKDDMDFSVRSGL